MSNSSILPMDRTLSGSTSSRQSILGIDGKEAPVYSTADWAAGDLRRLAEEISSANTGVKSSQRSKIIIQVKKL